MPEKLPPVLLCALLFAFALAFTLAGHAVEYRSVDSADGLPIAVAQWGDSDGPDVLLLHGAGFSKEYWLQQRSDAVDRCARFVAPDLRGHGASGKPWTEEQVLGSTTWAADLQGVIDTFDMREVLIVGWSYGGYVAMDYLRHHGSERIRGVLLVGSAAGLVPRPEGGSGELPEGFVEAAQQRRSLDLRDNRLGSRYIADLMTERGLTEDERGAWTLQMIASPVYFRKLMSRRTLENSDLIERLDLPVRFLLGGRDLSVSIPAIEGLAASKPGIELRVSPAAGHAVSHDDPQMFFESLLAMLSKDRLPDACTAR
jgi:non-heme chloroperoxidase